MEVSMSKNIIIQEGGQPKTLTADKLDTTLSGGGWQDWIPEDNVPLGTKSITEDGTYKASSENLYGYSEVTVRGIGTATGKDSNGNTHVISTDTQGMLVDKILPERIIITTLPTKLIYADGESIDLTGMVVTAYKGDGTIWTDDQHPDGIIALADITYEPTVADIDAPGGVTYMIVTFNERVYNWGSWYWTNYDMPVFTGVYASHTENIQMYFTRYGDRIYVGANAGNQIHFLGDVGGGGAWYGANRVNDDWNVLNLGEPKSASEFLGPTSPVSPETMDVYNDITISWTRDDGQELEAHFMVKVTPSVVTGGGGTTEGGGGAGRND